MLPTSAVNKEIIGGDGLSPMKHLSKRTFGQ